MPWYFPWSDNIKKRSCRYLLQRYLGQFLEEKLSLDQLTVDLYNGTGSVSDVTLDVQALNELGEQQNWPIEFIDGFISEISVSIPWSSLLCESSSVEVKGLYLAIQPKQRVDNGMSMFESMRSSMTSSIQLAEECLKETSNESEQITPLDGLELFAETIDSILTRVKLNFVDSIIRLEHLPKESKVGIALEIHIKHFNYFDESSSDATNLDENVKHASSFSVKNLSLQGISLYMDEFHSNNRTICRSLMIESTTSLHQNCTEEVDAMNAIQQTIEKQRNINAENIILIGQILGRQQIRIKIKQGENTSGHKFDFEANINSIIILLSPRQLHALCEIVYGLMSPHLQDNSNVSRCRFHEKPMSTFDFERVEQELIQQVNPSGHNQDNKIKCLQNTAGWSSAGAIGDDSDDDFRPIKNVGTSYSLSSSITNSVTSSNSNQTDNYQYNSKSQAAFNTYNNQRTRNKTKGGFNVEYDLIGDLNRFHVGLNSISVVLLHDDVFKQEINYLPSESSVNLMQNISNQFFTDLTTFYINGYNLDVMNRRQLISNAIPNYTYFSLMANTVLVSLEQKNMNTSMDINGTFTTADFELLECLRNNENNPEYIELLRFLKNEKRSDEPLPKFTVSSKPDIFIRFKYTDNRKRYSNPRDIDIQTNIQQCWSEIDVTVIDRLNDIMKHLKQFHDSIKEKEETKDNNVFYHVANSSPTDMRFEWKITAAFYLIKFRIPIPNMIPCYQHQNEMKSKRYRNVYDDIFIIELIDPSLQSNMTTHQMANSYELQSSSFRVLFQEANTDEPIPFILSCADEPAGVTLPNHGLGFGWPRLVLRKYPVIPYVDLGDDENEMEKSKINQSIVMDQGPNEPSPFAAKKIMRQSESNPNGEGEESILPGSKEEISNFIDDASTSALIQLDISLPNITIRIPSKHFYELIYNRMSNDLLLWSPANSKTSQTHFKYSNTQPKPQHKDEAYESFSMCKSSTKYVSDSEEENDNEVESNKSKKKNDSNKQSKLTISIFAAQAVLDILPHARDTTGNVIPEQFGEIQILIEEGSLFLVSGYKGRPLLSFICLQLNRLSLYHLNLIPRGAGISLRHVNNYPSKYLKSTIYRTEQTAIVNDTFPQVGIGSCNSDDMFTLAVKIHANEKRVKDICIASSLCGSTLRYRSAQAYGSWLTQLINFFDVIDYPILNYQPMKIITQLHQQFLNCIIDYRPLHIPYRTVVSFDTFNISSNITAKMSSSVLRFVAEEVSVFISNKPSNNDVIDIRNEYVCVLDMGLFDLSLRLSSDNTDGGPRTDLRASINTIIIRTCADSAVVLMELVKYVASDGDFVENKKEYNNKKRNNNINNNNNKDKDKDSLIRIKNDDIDVINLDIMSSYMDNIPDLMDEAINDTSTAKSNNKKGRKKHENESVEMFFFPDEENHIKVSNISSDSQTSDDEFENDYCLLENDFPMTMSKTISTPEVRMLTNAPIKLVDNYFSLPMARVDVLKAPKDYPTAIARYTLREMTLIWHMYAGHDFEPDDKSPNSSPKHHKESTEKERSSCQDLTTVAYYDNKELSRPSSLDSMATSRTSSCEFSAVQFLAARSSPSFHSSSSSSRSSSLNTLCEQKVSNWKRQGGALRQHDVLLQLQLTKMKYQYEVYPETTKQASRQVLVVQEVEIRDRLASSNINKLLYQYFSSSRPKQSNANMVVIKATNIRPEKNMKHIEECCLRVSILPLRLNIDQDSLLFLISFINNICGNSKEMNGNVSDLPIEENDNSIDDPSMSNSDYDTPLFIRSFVFSPEVPIRLDYEGKRIDMTHGPLAGLVMGLGKLNCSELRLKGIYNRHGFLGFDKLISYVLSEWTKDIKKNQLPSILGGVGPMYSLVQLFHGIMDLFWLPIEQYQKDGRIVRGLQKGANSFTTSTAMAALELTTRIVYAIQRIAETAFDIVSPGPSVRCLKYYDKSTSKHDTRKNSKYKYNQPADIREGVANAFLLVREGFGETAQTLVRVASIEHEVKGTVGAVGGVLRQIPSTALTPIILASQATSNVLGGVKSQLVPDARAEAALKWRKDYY